MNDSQQVLEWIAEGESKGEAKALLRILARRFPQGAPAEMASAIQAMRDLARLEAWVDAAATADSLEAFRQAAGF